MTKYALKKKKGKKKENIQRIQNLCHLFDENFISSKIDHFLFCEENKPQCDLDNGH